MLWIRRGAVREKLPSKGSKFNLLTSSCKERHDGFVDEARNANTEPAAMAGAISGIALFRPGRESNASQF